MGSTIAAFLDEDVAPPSTVTVTRYYDGSLTFDYQPPIAQRPLSPERLLDALTEFASSTRRLWPQAGEEEEEAEGVSAQRAELAQWATEWQERLRESDDLRRPDGTQLLEDLRAEVEQKSNPDTAEMVEAVLDALTPVLQAARKGPVVDSINALIEDSLPVLIYFENYGLLESAVWLPRFVQDLERDPNDSRVRTVNAMFEHVGLDPREIASLGGGEASRMRAEGQQPTPQQIASEQQRVEERAIKLSSASLDISQRFSEWWSQRRHKIRYHADGDYFRIWIADDRRPDVEIELESRSKGFQWFFSFYLVFLVESGGGHKEAILLLDEPGLHLHPTAQQELIAFFERLSETNQIAYTTHSPFLIDGEHLHRVRPVTEDDSGHSRITAETWPKDRETIFPLQAAAGYAMLRGLFQHQNNVLVEGMSDFYYLHALSQQCARTGRTTRSEDVYITPCGGARNVGGIASLFLGQDVRPLVLLDGDDAGRARRDSLMKELYVGHDSNILMLDDILNRPGKPVEIEDILGEDVILAGLRAIGPRVSLEESDRSTGSLPDQIKAAAQRQGIDLPEGWKASVALHLVSSWAEDGTTLADDILDMAASVFDEINKRFKAGYAIPV